MSDAGVTVLPAERVDRGLLLVAPFAAALFGGAALMFVAEPLVGKLVLPRLGGSPAVWNTCVVFYQAVVLAGYAYAHLLGTRLPFRAQAAVQLALLGLAGLTLPIAFPADWQPPLTGSPIPFVLLGLTVGVGVPFFALAATSPLLQAWFARTGHATARDPYYLYGASNAGSVLALLAYPLLIEPSSTLGTQREAWSVGFGLLVLLTLACALAAGRQTAAVPAASPGSVQPAAIGWRRRARWLALAAVPSSLMLGVTTYASTDLAAVPLLWTIPLALYLLTFILAFARRRLISGRVAQALMTGLVLSLMLVLVLGLNQPARVILPLHAVTLFVVALVLHTALADDRPDPARLTEFYFWIAAGGVLGGLFNAVAAPLLFNSVAEYPLAIVAASLLGPAAFPPRGAFRGGRRALVLVGWGAALLAGVLTGLLLHLAGAGPQGWALPLLVAAIYSTLAVGVRARVVGAIVLCVWLAGVLAPRTQGDVRYAQRTFFGVLRIRYDPGSGQHILRHGTTTHGSQFTDPERRREPLTYYHRAGPIGQLFAARAGKLANARIGVIGLGAGSLAAYAEPGQHWTFYELDPEVERIARDRRYFTFLADCRAAWDVVLGDARLSLARATGARYDVLIVDAFSSDAIPVHLLTREAFRLYRSRLAPGGIVVFHISNRHLALAPVVAGLAAGSGLTVVRQEFEGKTPDRAVTPSEWVAVGPERALQPLLREGRWARVSAPDAAQAWTDDYSNIVGAFRRLSR